MVATSDLHMSGLHDAPPSDPAHGAFLFQWREAAVDRLLASHEKLSEVGHAVNAHDAFIQSFENDKTAPGDLPGLRELQLRTSAAECVRVGRLFLGDVN